MGSIRWCSHLHGTTLTSAGHSTVRFWDAATGQEENTLTRAATGGSSIAFSPDGTMLTSTKWDHTVRLWDVETGQQKHSLTGHTDNVTSMVFSPDGTMLASGSHDGTILLWDMSPYVAPQPVTADFDGDGTVGFPDFLQFAAQVGLSQGDAGFDARFDLDGDGTVEFNDFVIFARSFGQGS